MRINRCKIISTHGGYSELEELVNEFIRYKDVKTISYAGVYNGVNGWTDLSALITYTEFEP